MVLSTLEVKKPAWPDKAGKTHERFSVKIILLSIINVSILLFANSHKVYMLGCLFAFWLDYLYVSSFLY